MKKFLVGGAVRDQLLNFPYSEKDWVVVGSTPKQMTDSGYLPVGKDFPVFLHPDTKEEYALARTERKTAPGYKGFTFYADPSVTLEEDLERRDLTINAIAQDDDGELIDPYDGQEDIERRQLRHVSLAFAEDPVRILRVARFSARYHYLGFTVAESTMDLMYAMVAKGETKHLVAERVWQELAKALQEKTPSLFFTILKLCGALNDIFPELDTKHYQNSLTLLSRLSGQSDNANMRFAATCYPLSKVTIEQLCKRLGAPNSFRETALSLSQYAQPLIDVYYKPDGLNAHSIATLLKQLDAIRKPERFHELTKGSAYLFAIKEPTPFLTFWDEALQHYRTVDSQALIEQGYEKAELGDAIFQQRIEQVSCFLSHHKKTRVKS